MSVGFVHLYEYDDPSFCAMDGINLTRHQLKHTCPDPKSLTDAKIKKMGVLDLLRLKGKLERDIEAFQNELKELERPNPFVRPEDRKPAINSAIGQDRATLVLIDGAIAMRKT